VYGEVRAIHAQRKFITQSAFLNQALLEAGDDLGIHTAMMVSGDVGNTLAHAIGQTNNELVSRSAGVECLFHRTHILNRLIREAKRTSAKRFKLDSAQLTAFGRKDKLARVMSI